MSATWKQSLKKFLSNRNEDTLKRALRESWADIYPEEKESIYQFLYQTKLHRLFTYLMTIDFQIQLKETPWLLFLKIIEEQDIKTPKEYFDELSLILVKQNILNEPAATQEDMFEALKQKRRHSFLQKMHKKKQELNASAQIAKSEQLMEQYIKYMNELKKISPSEYNVTSIISNREKTRAEGILHKRRRTKIEDLKDHSISEEERAILQSIRNQSEKYFKDGKANATDFAYLFRSMNHSEHALHFMNEKNDGLKKDWQLLDYLFFGKQYLSLLDHCSYLKQKYEGTPDALFSIYYVEAISYWELGEKDKALDLMTQISSMRPSFKSATEILSQWKEESFD